MTSRRLGKRKLRCKTHLSHHINTPYTRHHLTTFTLKHIMIQTSRHDMTTTQHNIFCSNILLLPFGFTLYLSTPLTYFPLFLCFLLLLFAFLLFCFCLTLNCVFCVFCVLLSGQRHWSRNRRKPKFQGACSIAGALMHPLLLLWAASLHLILFSFPLILFCLSSYCCVVVCINKGEAPPKWTPSPPSLSFLCSMKYWTLEFIKQVQ